MQTGYIQPGLLFFSNTTGFRKWVRGLDASANIDEMAASYNTAKNIVFGIIEKTLWDLLLAYYINPEPPDQKKATLVEYIQSALANFTMIDEFPYIAAESDKEWYKYEVDGQLNRYRNNGWSALNNMISFLDANSADFTAWAETEAYTERQKLIISDHKEFDRIYSIDQSAYFFCKIIFLQKEVIRDIILPRIKAWDEVKENTSVAEAVKLVIVYQCMAWAVKRIDYMNLPPSIRKVVTNEQTKIARSGDSVQKAIDNLGATLQLKADGYIKSLEYEIVRMNDTDYTIEEISPNLNDKDNKFYAAI